MVQAVSILIRTPEGALILQQRDTKPDMDGPGKVGAWGGACEPGEEPIETAVRELREELGLSVGRRDLTFWRRYRKTKQVHGKDETVFAFILRLRIKPETLTVYEGVGYHILHAEDDLARVNLTPLARELVRDFFQE